MFCSSEYAVRAQSFSETVSADSCDFPRNLIFSGSQETKRPTMMGTISLPFTRAFENPRGSILRDFVSSCNFKRRHDSNGFQDIEKIDLVIDKGQLIGSEARFSNRLFWDKIFL
ncbi:hypothetical protein NPIL_322891 [Nephila pilipes]|uniref:Uncharacterized protein n=1 Tax=Nephila pilipes TaxID=299642 RepID=A0A8X6PAT3_NEPPI|nr:hypothetical protein NPIL_322891 [Nephila pilipes]